MPFPPPGGGGKTVIGGTNITVATTAGKDKVSLDTASGIVLAGTSATAGGIGYTSTTATFKMVGNGTTLTISSAGASVAVGQSAKGYTHGVGLGYLATGASYGVAVGYTAHGYTNGVAVGSTAQGYTNGVAVGQSTHGHTGGVAVGQSATGHTNGVAVGQITHGYTGGVAVGYGATGHTNGVAVGSTAQGYTDGVAVGRSARGQRHGVAVGFYAGKTLTTTTTRFNVFIGNQAGYAGNGVTTNHFTTAKYGVCIGATTGLGSATQHTYITCLGYKTHCTAAGAVAIGVSTTGVAASATLANQIALGTTVHLVKFSNNTTGTGSAALGSNCPAATVSAPFTWIKLHSKTGTVVYVPAWK